MQIPTKTIPTESKLPRVRDMVEEYYQNEMQKHSLMELGDEDSVHTFNQIELRQDALVKLMLKKTNNIKHVLTLLNTKRDLVQTEISSIDSYLKELKQKQKFVEDSVVKVKDLVKNMVETAGEPTDNGNLQIKTDIGTFTVYETDGPIDLKANDPYNFPEEMTRTNISIDKLAIRKHLKDNNETELVNSNGDVVATIDKVKRLRIS